MSFWERLVNELEVELNTVILNGDEREKIKGVMKKLKLCDCDCEDEE